MRRLTKPEEWEHKQNKLGTNSARISTGGSSKVRQPAAKRNHHADFCKPANVRPRASEVASNLVAAG